MQFIVTVIVFAFAGISLCAPPLNAVDPYRYTNFGSGFDLAGKIESGQFAAVSDPSANDRKNFGDPAPLLISTPLDPIHKVTRGGSGGEGDEKDIDTTTAPETASLDQPLAEFPVDFQETQSNEASHAADRMDSDNDETDTSDGSGAAEQSVLLDMPHADVSRASNGEETRIDKNILPKGSAEEVVVEEKQSAREPETNLPRRQRHQPAKKQTKKPTKKGKDKSKNQLSLQAKKARDDEEDEILKKAKRLSDSEQFAAKQLVHEAAFWANMRQDLQRNVERFIKSEPAANVLFNYVSDSFRRSGQLNFFPSRTNALMSRIQPLMKKPTARFPAAAAFAFNSQIIIMEAMKDPLAAAELAADEAEIRSDLIKAAFRDNDREKLAKYSAAGDYSSLINAAIISSAMVSFEDRAELYQKLFPDFKLPEGYSELELRFRQVGDRISAVAHSYPKGNIL